ncbi:sucrose phosphate synthase 3F, partial [Thalictrum thalictroides]
MASDQNGPEPQDQVKQILSKIRKPPSQQQNCDGGTKHSENVGNKYPMLRRRPRLIVVAVDCYNNEGNPD